MATDPAPQPAKTEGITYRRTWAMPSPWTFSIAPIGELVRHVMSGCETIVDPFCGQSTFANVRNDLAADEGKDAIDWLDALIHERGKAWADGVILDPPYSPRQISECYEAIGRTATTKDTQNARLYKQAVERLSIVLKPGGVAVRCGWNSAGFGKDFQLTHVLMVCHGGAHNDTIVTVEKKVQGSL